MHGEKKSVSCYFLMATNFYLTFPADLSPARGCAVRLSLPERESLLLSAPVCKRQDEVRRKPRPNKVRRGLEQLMRG